MNENAKMTRVSESNNQASSKSIGNYPVRPRFLSQALFDEFSDLMKQITDQFSSFQQDLKESPHAVSTELHPDSSDSSREAVVAASLRSQRDHQQQGIGEPAHSDTDEVDSQEITAAAEAVENTEELPYDVSNQSESSSALTIDDEKTDQKLPQEVNSSPLEDATAETQIDEAVDQQLLAENTGPIDQSARSPISAVREGAVSTTEHNENVKVQSNVQQVPLQEAAQPDQQDIIHELQYSEHTDKLDVAASSHATRSLEEPVIVSSTAGFVPSSGPSRVSDDTIVNFIRSAALAPSASQSLASANPETGLPKVESIQGALPSGETAPARDFSFVKSQDSARQLDTTRAQRQVPRSALLQNMEKVEGVLKELSRANDGKSVSIRFDPPELGTVRVDVQLRDGALHARLTAESSQVNQLLRERAQELQGILRRLGLDVDRVSVAVGSDGDSRMWDGAYFADSQQSFSEKSSPGADRGGLRRHSFEQVSGGALPQAEVTDHWIA